MSTSLETANEDGVNSVGECVYRGEERGGGREGERRGEGEGRGGGEEGGREGGGENAVSVCDNVLCV